MQFNPPALLLSGAFLALLWVAVEPRFGWVALAALAAIPIDACIGAFWRPDHDRNERG